MKGKWTPRLIRWGALAAFLLVIFFGVIWWFRGQWIPAGYVGIIATPSGLRQEVLTPRRVVVPWMCTLYTYPTKTTAAIYSSNPQDGEVKAADAVQVTTSDNLNIPFNITVWYRVMPKDVFLVFKSFGNSPIETIQAQNIRSAVKEAASAVGATYETFALMGPKREEASQQLTTKLQELLSTKGITIERAYFAGCDPGPLAERMLSRINSQTELKSAQIRSQIAEIQKQITIVTAEGETKAQAISAGTTKDRSIRMLQLENAIAAAKKWNGRLPPLRNYRGPVLLDQSLMSQMMASQDERGGQMRGGSGR